MESSSNSNFSPVNDFASRLLVQYKMSNWADFSK